MHSMLCAWCKNAQAIAFHCSVLARALAHGLLAGRCELQCVDCVSLEVWCFHLHLRGSCNEFVVIGVLIAQQFNVQRSSETVSTFRGRLYDGIRSEGTGVNAEAATFRQERGAMKHVISLRWKCWLLGLWLDPVSCLYKFVCMMFKDFFAGFRVIVNSKTPNLS